MLPIGDHVSSARRLYGPVLVAAVALIFAFAALLSGCGTSSPVEQALVVRRNLLFEGSHRWVASGANDYILPFYSDGATKADPDLAAFTAADFRLRRRIFRAMREDGINIVRVPVGLPGFQGHLYGLSMSAYIHRLQLVVSAARAQGLRVLICWFDSLGMGSALPREYRRDFPFMRAVAHALSSDASVMYEPDNEPNGVSTEAWLRVMDATVREWRSVIRYRGPLVIDTPGYSWSFPEAAAASLQRLDASLLHGRSQLVFANHRYPDGAACFCGATERSWKHTVGRWVSKFPILGTEYGAYVQGFPANRHWLRGMISYLRRDAVPRGDNGMIAFVWSWVDANSLTTGNHVSLDRTGRDVRSAYWRRARFEGPSL